MIHTRRLLTLAAAVPLLLLTACDTFVQQVDSPKNAAPRSQLDTQRDVVFLTDGVKTQGAIATAQMTYTSGLLSDQFRFGTSGDATFPTFAGPDAGTPTLQNTSVSEANSQLGEYRRLADRLLDTVNRIAADSGTVSASVAQEARFTGHLHGAIARYYYATYTGRNPREGGGIINRSEFIPSPAMYDSARVKFNTALEFAPTTKDTAIVKSLHARSALYAATQFNNVPGYNDALARAAELAQDGLTKEQGEFIAPFSLQSVNYWWEQGGPSRYQIVLMDDKLNSQVRSSGTHKALDQIRGFKDILLEADTLSNGLVAQVPTEETRRVPIDMLAVTGGAPPSAVVDNGDLGVSSPFFAVPVTLVPNTDPPEISGNAPFEIGQNKFDTEPAPVRYISWEEMNLIKAELELRGEDASSSTPTELVNTVRSDGTLPGTGASDEGLVDRGFSKDATFDLPPLSNVDLETLARERDLTLLGQGQRLPDQRRLEAVEWHLVETVPGGGKSWQYLPLTSQERDNNPNFP